MLLFMIALALAAAGQVYSPPPIPETRDARQLPEAAGTAVVRGRVVTADGRPVKHVIVTLGQMRTGESDFDQNKPSGTRPVSRRALTDAQGQFEFEHLPGGFYRLAALPELFQAQYLTGGYGQQGPYQPGAPFELTEGQVLTGATIVMPRSGVITGRVTDDEGEPVARVSVSMLFFAPGASGPTRNGEVETDDLGRYRAFGLRSGDYLVFADVRSVNRLEIDSEADPVGFMTTYFPGVPSASEAQRVQVRPGAETSGVDFRLLRGRLFTISGTVFDSQGQPLRG